MNQLRNRSISRITRPAFNIRPIPILTLVLKLTCFDEEYNSIDINAITLHLPMEEFLLNILGERNICNARHAPPAILMLQSNKIRR